MTENEKHYLQQMGIDLWQVRHPERLAGYSSPSIQLPQECQLLLVAASCPTQQIAVFFEKVLKSMQLDLAQARHITPEQLSQIEEWNVKWVWFAGCEATPLPAASYILHSPPLGEIDGHTEHRRALWQQIRSYE